MNDDEQFEINFDAPEPEPEPRPSLIDPEATKEAAEEGMEGAEHLSDDHYKIEMLQAIRAVAERMLYFRADHVWDELGGVGDGDHDNGSGLGPMLRLAAASGVMKHADHQRSQRASTHGRPLTLWKSLIFRGSDQEKP